MALTQTQLATAVADRGQLSKADAKRALAALDEVVLDELGNAENVRIGGLVQLTARVRPAQKARKGLTRRVVRSRSPPSRRASTCGRGHWRGRRERCHRCKRRVVGWLPDHARRAARFTSACQARASAPVANARRAAYAANATPTAADRLGEVRWCVCSSAAPGPRSAHTAMQAAPIHAG